jgi:hypothetical protein
MAMDNPELLRIVNYILKRARHDELGMIRAALDARAAEGPKSINDLNFRDMARSMSQEISQRFGLSSDGQHMKDMARRLVTDMIRQNIPDIPEKDLQILLNQWLDNRQSHAGKEELLPVEAVESMIDQFVRYSLRMMSEEEAAKLKAEVPDWVDRYWEIFSMDTRHLLRSLLHAEIDTKEFWTHIRQRLDRRKS